MDTAAGWFEDAYDYAFGGSEPETPSYGDSGQYKTSIPADLDLDGSGSIGDKSISSYNPNQTYDFGQSGFDMPSYDFIPGVTKPAGGPADKPWYTNPNVLGAAITAGSGLLGGLSQMNMQKQAIKAQEEQRKMNQMLELAKLKYQLLGKGASGSSGGRRGSGGPDPRQAINSQASAQLSNGYQALGGNLASIYR